MAVGPDTYGDQGMSGGRERVIEIGGATISRDGWTVAVAYIGQDKGLKWSAFSHSQKGRAQKVYRNLERSAHEVRIYRRGRLVAVRKPDIITVTGDADFERFLKE